MVYFNKKKVNSRGLTYFVVTDKKSITYGEILDIRVGIQNHNLRFGTIYPKENELNTNLKIDDEIANYRITDRPVPGFPNLFETERCVD